MTDRIGLGFLTPSSNSVLEPVSSALLAETPNVSAHFARFRVTEIALSHRALAQFDNSPRLAAAELLADARVKCICWSGTSAGWLGLETDFALCAAIERRTGIAASSSVLSLVDAFRWSGVKSYGLVTPYTHDVQDRIIATFRNEGFDCVAERHCGLSDNFSFSLVPTDRLTAMVREVAQAAPEAIAILCTNLRGATLAETLEKEIGIPIYDSVATGIWGAMRLAEIDPGVIRTWGRLFREVRSGSGRGS